MRSANRKCRQALLAKSQNWAKLKDREAAAEKERPAIKEDKS
jgi:hypothetical protein